MEAKCFFNPPKGLFNAYGDHDVVLTRQHYLAQLDAFILIAESSFERFIYIFKLFSEHPFKVIYCISASFLI